MSLRLGRAVVLLCLSAALSSCGEERREEVQASTRLLIRLRGDGWAPRKEVNYTVVVAAADGSGRESVDVPFPGQATIDLPEEGRYDVTPYLDGEPVRRLEENFRGHFTLGEILMVASNTTTTVEFVIPRAGELAMVLKESRGLDHPWYEVRREGERGEIRPLSWQPVPRLVRDDGVLTATFSQLPTGKYEIVVRAAGRSTIVAHGEVSDDVRNVVVAQAPETLDTRLELTFGHEIETPMSYILNRWDVLGEDAQSGFFTRDQPVQHITQLRSGRYLARLPKLSCAYLFDFSGKQSLELEPPEDIFDRGGASLDIEVRFDGRVPQYVSVLLALKELESGTWVRGERAGAVPAQFRDLPPGKYRVFVVDGLLGESFGVGLVERQVEVAKTSEVRTLVIDIPR